MEGPHQNQLMVQLNKNYQNYLELLTENDYFLALPSNQVLANCTIDGIFIYEHILQSSFDGKELQSLNGKTYEIHDKKLVLQGNPSVQIDILSTDVCYADSTGKHFKRMQVNNSLDQRFFNKHAQSASDTQKGENGQGEAKGKSVMREPFEFIQFFKREVYHDIEEDYQDFLESIRQLKENHILLKGHEIQHKKRFKQIADGFKLALAKSSAVNEQFGQLDDNQRQETLENFVEVLIYERIGTYLRKTLIGMYSEEERIFNNKVAALYKIYVNDLKRFNDFYQCELTKDMIPTKSLQIFKVFFRCQLPYEMSYTLHQTALIATEEVAKYLGKSKSSIDAQTLFPYLLLIILMARDQIEREDKPFNLKVRLLMMEHFTVHVFGMSEQDYSLATFKEAEKTIEEGRSVMD